VCAEWALDLAVAEMAATLRQSGDPTSPNAATISSSSKIACSEPWLASKARWILPKGGAPGVLVAPRSVARGDSRPDQRAGAGDHHRGSARAPGHTAILAAPWRSRPSLAVPNLLARVGSGDLIVVDGVHGLVAITPSPNSSLIRMLARAFSDVAKHRRQARDRPIRTRCGETVSCAQYRAASEAERRARTRRARHRPVSHRVPVLGSQ